MNKIAYLSAAALTLALALPATAQQPTLQDRATTLTQQMAHKVPLNEAQYVKVRQLNLTFLSSTQELKARLASDPATLDLKLAELQDRYDWDLATILWPRQMAIYDRSRTNMTALDLPR